MKVTSFSTPFSGFQFKRLCKMASIHRSSFQKKGTPRTNFINGTKPSLHNSQLLVSSGMQSFDDLIGKTHMDAEQRGGIPVGSLILINEDEYGAYARFFLKYFLAEGVVSKHATYVCSKDENPEELIRELPSPVDAEIDDGNEIEESDKKMTIAWRYENLKTVSFSSGGNKHFGHYFDLSRKMDEKTIKNSNITYWSNAEVTSGQSFKDSDYWFLLNSIKKKLEEGQYFADQTSSDRNILRIGLHHLNSPLWSFNNDSESSSDSIYFLTFMYSLRALIRNAYATCIVTLPFGRYKKDLVEKSIYLSDITIQLETFAGTECENVAPYKNYHGFFIIQKLAAINSLIAYNPKATNLAFKLKRKKLVIEEFNLPPELEESTEREQDKSSFLACSSSRSSKYDF